MSRKKRAPKKIPVVDPKFKSSIIPKLVNSIMFDGKKTTAEKIVYDALNKIKSKSKDEPINVFNEAIKDGKKIKIQQIENDGMWGIGTPEDLNYFLKNYKGYV